jgi:hypothetical protein
MSCQSSFPRPLRGLEQWAMVSEHSTTAGRRTTDQ